MQDITVETILKGVEAGDIDETEDYFKNIRLKNLDN